jgi:carboxyl-terminal processing protease
MPRTPLIVLLIVGITGIASAALPATGVIDEVSRTVQAEFYDPTLRGLDWSAVTARYRSLVQAAASDQERAVVINRMLGELHASHTAYFERSDPAYYDLLDVFADGLRDKIRRLFPDGEVAYTGIGVFTRPVDAKTFVSGVLDGLPAKLAGLQVGDEIVAVDGKPYAPIESFVDKRGAPVVLTIRRTPQGAVRELVVVPERIRPSRAYLAAMAESARIIERDGRRIGYIHVWSYAGAQYQTRLEHELHAGKLKDADALIWDLRDGWGGAQPHYLDVFSGRGPVVQRTDRAGKQVLQNVKWRRPVVMLINGGTRSGKEILAYGFKKYGIGELIGTKTTGAILAARGFVMSDGSLLEVAVEDVTLDGERLEGVGVTPTVEVPFRLPYAQGADPQLEYAVAMLASRPRATQAPPRFLRARSPGTRSPAVRQGSSLAGPPR